mgnify:CR=1 FL=1
MITYIKLKEKDGSFLMFHTQKQKFGGEFLDFTAKLWDLVGLRLTGYQSCISTVATFQIHNSQV